MQMIGPAGSNGKPTYTQYHDTVGEGGGGLIQWGPHADEQDTTSEP